MNKELICTPVMLPKLEGSGGFGSIMVDTRQNRLWLNEGVSYNCYFHQAQHLYLVSSEAPKIGDYRYHEDIGISKFNGFDANEDDKKVIATTDKSLSLPLIPSSFIERWVNAQGKIDEVRVKMTNKPTMMSTTLGKFVPMENANEEIIILPIEDKTFTREEVKAIASETWRVSRQDPDVFAKDYGFDKWFDKHY